MSYDLNDIDDHGCLKPGLAMLFASLILSRQIFYYPVSLLAKRRGRGSSGANIDMSFLHVITAWEIAACVPAFIVLVLVFMRKPAAGNTVRKLWAQSKNLLIAGALAQSLTFLYLLTMRGMDSPVVLVSLALSILLLFYAVTSQRLAHVVKEFPSPDGKSAEAGR